MTVRLLRALPPAGPDRHRVPDGRPARRRPRPPPARRRTITDGDESLAEAKRRAAPRSLRALPRDAGGTGRSRALARDGAARRLTVVSPARFATRPGMNVGATNTLTRQRLEPARTLVHAEPRPVSSPGRVLATMLFTDIVSVHRARHPRSATVAGASCWSSTTAPFAGSSSASAAVSSTPPGTASSPPSTTPARAISCAQAIVAALADIGIDVRAGIHTAGGFESKLCGPRSHRGSHPHRAVASDTSPGPCATWCRIENRVRRPRRRSPDVCESGSSVAAGRQPTRQRIRHDAEVVERLRASAPADRWSGPSRAQVEAEHRLAQSSTALESEDRPPPVHRRADLVDEEPRAFAREPLLRPGLAAAVDQGRTGDRRGGMALGDPPLRLGLRPAVRARPAPARPLRRNGRAPVEHEVARDVHEPAPVAAAATAAAPSTFVDHSFGPALSVRGVHDRIDCAAAPFERGRVPNVQSVPAPRRRPPAAAATSAGTSISGARAPDELAAE